jgi:hypothetical protein
MIDIIRSVSWKTEEFSDWASWKRYLHPWSRIMVRKVGKSPSRGPHTSKDVFSTPSARSLVESVCTRSCGSRMLTRTRRSSTIDGSPSEIPVNVRPNDDERCYHVHPNFSALEASSGLCAVEVIDWLLATGSSANFSEDGVGAKESVPAAGTLGGLNSLFSSLAGSRIVSLERTVLTILCIVSSAERRRASVPT